MLAVGAACAFGFGLWYMEGKKSAMEFFAGYLIEESLSVDNIFVFIMLFEYFKVRKGEGREGGGREGVCDGEAEQSVLPEENCANSSWQSCAHRRLSVNVLSLPPSPPGSL